MPRDHASFLHYLRGPNSAPYYTNGLWSLSLATCTYNNDACILPRAMKANGQLHRFCAFHRARYSAYQRSHLQRQRVRRAEQVWTLGVEDEQITGFHIASDSGERSMEEQLTINSSAPSSVTDTDAPIDELVDASVEEFLDDVDALFQSLENDDEDE